MVRVHGRLPDEPYDPSRVVHPDDLPAVYERTRTAQAEGRPMEAEARLRRFDGEYRWHLVREEPRRSEGGKVVGYFGSSTDVHDLREAQARTEGLLASADIGTWVLDVERGLVFADANLARMYEVEAGEGEGVPLDVYLSRIHPSDLGIVQDRIGRAVQASEPYDVEYRVVTSAGERWVSARGRPRPDESGRVTTFPGVVVDVTALKRAQVSIEGQLRTTRTIAENADSPLMLLDRQGFTNYANPAFYRATGYSPEDTRGKTAHELIHYRYPDGRPFPIEECPIDSAYWNLQAARNLDLTFVRKDGGLFPVVAHVAPLTGEDGGMQGGVLEFRDVTEQRELERALAESADEYRQIAEGLPSMVWSAGPDGVRDYFNARWLEYTGMGLGESENPWLAVLHPEDGIGRWASGGARSRRAGRSKPSTGFAAGMGATAGSWAALFRSGTTRARSCAGSARAPTCTSSARPRRRSRSPTSSPRRSPRTSTSAASCRRSATPRPRPSARSSARSSTTWSNEQGEAFLLYTLSGAPIEAFENFGLPQGHARVRPDLPERGDRALGRHHEGPALRPVRARTTACPQGHLPVVSYLAVPVVSRSGEVIGGLFFGHPQAGVFTEEHEAIVSAFAAQAAVAMDNARLYERVASMNQELELKVEERTAELLSAVERLQGFTYHVSHDLRAPLRAISSTSHVIREDYGESLPEEAHGLLGRQAEAATRLGQLVDDLLKTSRLSRQDMVRQPVDLTHLARDAAAEALSTHPYSTVRVRGGGGIGGRGGPEAASAGSPQPRRERGEVLARRAERLRVGRRADGAYYVSDEGIGIDARYFHKIFEPFQRLHLDSEIAGTGIGLANVRQVVERHGGKVWVESELGKGSTFLFTLG